MKVKLNEAATLRCVQLLTADNYDLQNHKSSETSTELVHVERKNKQSL